MSAPGFGSGLASGLCSVTCRQLGVAGVVDLAARAGLAGIEWGADVHVPPGDLDAAADAARRTIDAGLRVASYGSYLFADPTATSAIGPVLDTAAAMGTDLVRVWCPFGVEIGATHAERANVLEALAESTSAAAARGMTLYLEFHGGTLTATAASAWALLDEVDAENLAVGWQPPYWDGVRNSDDHLADLADLALLGPRLAHVHVYEWATDLTRHPLVDGAAHWPAALTAVASAGRPGLDRFALLEFVADDDPARVIADAATLRQWLEPHDPGVDA